MAKGSEHSRTHSDRYRPPAFQFGQRDRELADSRRGEFDFESRYDTHGHQTPRFTEQPQRAPPRVAGQTSQRPHRPAVQNSYRPSNSHPPHSGEPNTSPRRGQRSRAPNSRGRGGRQAATVSNGQQNRRPWVNHPPTSSRPLLQSQREPTPDQLVGMNHGGARFKALNDLSESEDASMELDSNSEDQNGVRSNDIYGPSIKRQKLSLDLLDNEQQAAVPKWSNPDPYTSLPPPNETTGKRLDVVKLIRKAKAFESGPKTTGKEGDDFIAFGSFDDEDQQIDDKKKALVQEQAGASDAPKSRKFSHLNNLYSSGAPGTTASAETLGPPPLPSKELKPQMNVETIDSWPPPQDAIPIQGRKRMRGETSGKSKGDGKVSVNLPPRAIVPEWIPKPRQDATPWMKIDHSSCEGMGIRLHKEICDFYDFVKPLKAENEMRHELVRRISQFVHRLFSGAEVAYFGSFAAGTYLPNADMDLVVLSRQFLENGNRTLGQNRKDLFKFANRLQSEGIARERSTCTIWKAKVPIIKFVDNYTGLRCDISFENSTGPTANDTYKEWKAQYPAMPVLVSLIKHFLLMRDLNEVHTGGLGSFTVNCLVVSLMQHMPAITSGNMDPMKNLGELLMAFFDFYGNKFNQATIGIQMEPPGYFPKRQETRVKINSKDLHKLCIIDPNKPDNDISSGTSQIVAILHSFSWAYKALQDRMNSLLAQRASIDGNGVSASLGDGSILSVIFAGDYRPFTEQRELMQRLWTVVR